MLMRQRTGGWTLIGLLVGMAVGLLVLGGAAQIYVQAFRDSTTVIRQTDLNKELRYLADFMARDIRRAGAWGWEPPANAGDSVSDYKANPFWQHGNDLAVHDYNGRTDACILLSYDLDGDTSVGVGAGNADEAYEDENNVERFGFRWAGEAVEIRTGGGDPFTCTDGSWQAVTDPRVRIKGLTFGVTAEQENLSDPGNACTTGDNCMTRREVAVTLSGETEGDPPLGQSVTSSVAVRNNRVVVQP